MSGFAWVTLATNDSYSLGALVLAHSLRQVGTAHQVAVLVTPGVTNAMRQKLAAVFNVVQEVNILDSKDEQNLRLLKRPELGITFTKLHCWRLTQFEKCVFMDADTLVMANSDELFEREEFSASPDVGWPDCFNSGVFVYRPSNETYDKLIDFAVQKGSFDGGDQGLLNLYFSDWAHKDISKHLPFIYNMCSTACYSYMPAFKQYGADVKIVHFVGPAKPWLQYFDTQTRKVHPSSGFQHMQIILQRWWDIFCSLIHPNLSPDMSGLAGAFAQFTLGVKRTPSQDALENHLRRQAWEVGNIDYMGRDSFDNIWSKICETLAATPLEKPAEPKPIEQTSSDASTQEKTTLSVEPAPKDVTGDAKEVPETAIKPETPQQIITIAEAPAPDSKISVEAVPIISQEIKVEPTTDVVETPVETSKSELPTETKPEPTPAQADVPQETKPESQSEVIQELQTAIPMPAALGEPIMSGDKPQETVATDAAKSDEPQKISAEPPKQEETPEVPKLEEPILPEIPTPGTTAGVDITKIQDVTKLEETSKPAELIRPEGTTVEVSPDAPKSEELPKEQSKIEDVVAKVEETPKITETPKAEIEATAPPKATESSKLEEPSKAEDAPKVEDTTKLEEVSKTEGTKTEEIKTEGIKTEEIKTEAIKTEEIKTEEIKTDLPQIQETAKTTDVSVDKDTKLEETAKTEPEKVIAAQIVEEIPKVDSKVDLPQESAKIEPVPEPETAVKVEAVSQGEAPKTEGIGSDAKVEVTTKIGEKQTTLDTKTESSKSQESASEAAKDSVAQTQKESQKTEETRKESSKTEEAPKEPTKVKKVSKDGKERKVKKVPKSDIKTDSPQEGATSSEAPAPEGESSTAPLTETPIPPPRKTTTTVKKVKAKKPSP